MATASAITKRVSKNRMAWAAGLAALVAAGIGTALYYGSKSASAAPSPAPIPSGTTWTRLTPVQSGNAYVVNIPANATFAVSVPGSDPQLANLVATLNQDVTAGTVGSPQAYQNGFAPPASYPQDGLGTTAYRAVGVAVKGFPLAVTQSTQVFVITG